MEPEPQICQPCLLPLTHTSRPQSGWDAPWRPLLLLQALDDSGFISPASTALSNHTEQSVVPALPHLEGCNHVSAAAEETVKGTHSLVCLSPLLCEHSLPFLSQGLKRQCEAGILQEGSPNSLYCGILAQGVLHVTFLYA